MRAGEGEHVVSAAWHSARKDRSNLRHSAAATAIGAFGFAVLIAFLALTSNDVRPSGDLESNSDLLQSVTEDGFDSDISEPDVLSEEEDYSPTVVKGPGGRQFQLPDWYIHHGIDGQEASSDDQDVQEDPTSDERNIQEAPSSDDDHVKYSSKAATSMLAESSQAGTCRLDCLRHDEDCKSSDPPGKFMATDCCNDGKVALGVMSAEDASCQSLGSSVKAATDAASDVLTGGGDDDDESEDDDDDEPKTQPQRDIVEVKPVETGEMSGPSWENSAREQKDIAETAYSAGEGEDVIPGASFLGYGYDGKKECTFEQCATLPVVQYTFDRKRTVTTPAGKFAVPDQMRVVNQYETNARTQVYSSFEQVEEAFTAEAGISGSSAAFSGSARASYSTSSSSTDENWYSNRKLDVRLYSLDVRVDDLERSTNPAFFADVKALPLRFLDSPRAFLKFIQKWGPHVVLDAVFGGTLEVTMVTSKKATESKSTVSMSVEAEYNGVMASGKMEASMSKSSASKKVAEQSMVGLTSNGGDPAVARVITDVVPGMEKPLFRGDFEAWVNSIPHFPRSISQVPKLTEIYKIVPGNTDDMISRRNALQIAGAIYVGDKTSSTHNMECHPDGSGGDSAGSSKGANEASNGRHQSTIDPSIVWANYNRISTNECLRFAARGNNDIKVVMASVVSRPETWYTIKVSRNGVAFFEGKGAQPVAESKNFGAAVMGSSTLFEDYWICVFLDKLAYGKGPSEFLSWNKGKPLLPVRYYAFGCDSPTSFASIQIVKPNCNWMGSATKAYLNELDANAGALQESIKTDFITLPGEGLQDNECHAWQCQTKVYGKVIKKDGEEWYQAAIKSSSEVMCDIRHVQDLYPDRKSVNMFLAVGHRRRPIGSDEEADFVTVKEYGWDVVLHRCPGEADYSEKPYRWDSCGKGTCYRQGRADFRCRCSRNWGGALCDKCNFKCIGASPNAACNGCKACQGLRDENDGCRCNAKSVKAASPYCVKVDKSCHFCEKCTDGRTGPKCDILYGFTWSSFSSCKTKSGHQCGSGTKTRTATCRVQRPKQQWKNTRTSDCTKVNLSPGTLSLNCNYPKRCGYKWTEPDFISPRKPRCGPYTKTRRPECVGTWDNKEVVGNRFCTQRQPSTTETVTDKVCLTAMHYQPSQKTVRGSTGSTTAHVAGWAIVAGGAERKSNTAIRQATWWKAGTSSFDQTRFQVGKHGESAVVVYVRELGECEVKTSTRSNVVHNQLACRAGYKLVAGGCETDKVMGSMRPMTADNAFQCGAWPKEKNQRGTVTTQTMCCRSDLIPKGCAWRTANKWTNKLTVSCPSGQVVYGGGCMIDAPGHGNSYLEIMTSMPVKQGWYCEPKNRGGQTYAFTYGYAFCCPSP